MLITLHMFSFYVVCTLNTQLQLLPFKRYTVLRQPVNGNFNLTPTVVHTFFKGQFDSYCSSYFLQGTILLSESSAVDMTHAARNLCT